MKKLFLSLALASIATMSLTSCGAATDKENIPLTLSSMELDGVFNPFYATAQPDSEILSNTQISMLTNTPKGEPAYGDDEAVVVKDLMQVTTGEHDVDEKTTYYLVLKNNVKFSNGSPLTIRDVLFNLYVYLDPVYTGSSTIYSTDIVGLKEYRTQEESEAEQENFEQQFVDAALLRRQTLAEVAFEIQEDYTESLTKDEFREIIGSYTENAGQENVLKDFDKAYELFVEELNNDFNNSKDQAKTIVFEDNKGKKYNGLLQSDVEAFLYNEGYIGFNKDEGKLELQIGTSTAELRSWSKEMAIDAVLLDKMPRDFIEIIMYWQTGNKLIDFIKNEEQSAFNSSMTEKKFPNISGIKFANFDTDVTVNGKNYPMVEYAEDGSVKNETNEVLTITINGVDPKAIWNFGFPVAPMYYYSDEEHVNAFDYADNKFGVQYGDSKWYETVVKNPDKTGVPVGAGPYMASKKDGGTDNVGPGDFKDKGVVYYEANPNFILGKPNIKLLRYKVIAQSNLLNSLTNNEIDFVQPNADPETVRQVDSMRARGYIGQKVKTSGYGYIGINASKVPSRFVRMVIMHCIDTSLTVTFYGNSAQAVHRSMSRASWAYPEGATPYYPFIEGPIPEDLTVVSPYYAEYVEMCGKSSGEKFTEEEIKEFIRWMLEDKPEEDGNPGYTVNGNGIYQEGNNLCKLTFTIAGSETDHPALQAFLKAKEILNKNHFDITVGTDAQALKKLNNGDLAVWAAAWGSTIDPDLFQIYHRDSKATSVNNWGYKAILNDTTGRYTYEYDKIQELSDKIDDGRSVLDQTVRAEIYKEALDMVMELAVELPTYQRDDLFAYNANKIDQKTLVQDVSPFNGLLSRIWAVNLVK